MLRYALLRLLGAIPTLFLVIVLAFLMVHAAPGGPFDDERVLPAEIEENIAAAYHLDEPLHKQFIRYLSGLVHGDLGPSYRYRDHTVGELIGTAFPVSLKLGAMAMLLALVVGVAAGSFAAARAAHEAIESELAATTRRLRAIERRWIPDHESALRRLEITLADHELEDVARSRFALEQSRS